MSNKPHQRTVSYVALYGTVQNQIKLKQSLKKHGLALKETALFSVLQRDIHRNAKDIALLQRHIRFLKVNHRRLNKTDRLPFESMEEMELIESKGRNLSTFAAGLSHAEKTSVNYDKKVASERARLNEILELFKGSFELIESESSNCDFDETSDGFEEMHCGECGHDKVTLRGQFSGDNGFIAVETTCLSCKTVTVISLPQPMMKAQSLSDYQGSKAVK